jgi:hypothetical protein
MAVENNLDAVNEYTASDKLGIVLFCFAGVMAIALFLVEKTPYTVASLLLLIVGLLIYPVLHFCKRKLARICVFSIVVIGTAGFGWAVWPSPKPSEGTNQGQPTQKQPNTTSQNTIPTQSTTQAAKEESTPSSAVPKSKPTSSPLPTQSSVSCAPGAICGISSGQTGGVTAGVAFVDTPPLKITWTAKDIMSNLPQFAYAQQITVSVNTQLVPVSLEIVFDSDIGALFPEAGVFNDLIHRVLPDNHTGLLKYSDPLSPGVPLTIDVYGKQAFTVKDVIRVN